MGSTQIIDRKVIYIYATQDLMALHCTQIIDQYGREVWTATGITPWQEIMPYAIACWHAAQAQGMVDRDGKPVQLLDHVQHWRKAARDGHLHNGKSIEGNILFSNVAIGVVMPRYLSQKFFLAGKKTKLTFSVTTSWDDDSEVLAFDFGNKESIDFLREVVEQIQDRGPAGALTAMDFDMAEMLKNCTNFGLEHTPAEKPYTGDLPHIALIKQRWQNQSSGCLETIANFFVQHDGKTGQVVRAEKTASCLIAKIAADIERSAPGCAESVIRCLESQSLNTQPPSGALYINLPFANDRVPVGAEGDDETELLRVVDDLYASYGDHMFVKIASGPARTDYRGQPIDTITQMLEWPQMYTPGAMYFFADGHEDRLGDNEQELIQSALLPFGYKMDEDESLDQLDGQGVAVIDLKTGEPCEQFSSITVYRLAERYSLNAGVTQ